MSFDLADLTEKVTQHGRVIRVVVAATKGSSPREVGAAMLVWATGQSGTIGGGALEFQAAETARDVTKDRITHHPLGPELGQCCGGAVTLLTEVFDAERIATVPQDVYVRAPEQTNQHPLKIAKMLAKARAEGQMPPPELQNGWMIEPVLRSSRNLWIWGAGHVGRAIVDVLAPLPDLQITWADTGPDRFPDRLPPRVDQVTAQDLPQLATHAPITAEHLILTYSHVIDLDLCHSLLQRGFASCGLIGSKTKWARFQNRLRALGHTQSSIDRIICPIGRPSLGKHPYAIAIGVADALLTPRQPGRSQPVLGAQEQSA
ncbi:xanthine dehydrogenase accessory protein XdhC [Algirhabdus cladophorae]|uniref:xanthine dehydrogenase accessory protein XdhC n=1 Tax=Algirhabdus cladophorae TaxID=3377108 RepID=UPI003B849EB2